MLEHAAQRGCGTSILGETQSPVGHHPERPALLELDWTAQVVPSPSLSGFGIL